MPSDLTHKVILGRRWDPPGGWPDSSPGSAIDCTLLYSSDLYETTNNPNAIRQGYLGLGRDIGGNFLVVKHDYDEASTLGTGLIHFSNQLNPMAPVRPHYVVPQRAFRARVDMNSFPKVTPSSDSVLRALGTTALARMNPRKPKVALATFVGELREGLPHALLIRDSSRERISRQRNAGDEYLNVEFGWKPLLRDLQKFHDVYRRSNELVQQMAKQSGKGVRKRHDFPTEHDVVEAKLGNANAVPNLHVSCYGNSSAGSLTRTTTTTTRRWCVATFMPYFPTGDDFDSKFTRFNRLYGVKPTPDTLWNLAPWSWAADWFANTGDIVSNLSYLGDSTALPHCYVMEHKTVKVEYFLRGYGNQYRSYPGEHTFYQMFQTETKRRISGSPFGFGIDWPDFSNRQLAIAAALGIGKSNKTHYY